VIKNIYYRIINRLAHHFVCNTKSNFVRRFNFVNNFFWKYPFEIKKTENALLQIVSKEINESLYIARPERVFLYKEGVASRKKQIIDEYQLSNLFFTDGDIIIDCGSNIGEFTVALQQLFGIRAICIEPEPQEVASLQKNVVPERTHIYDTVLWKEQAEIRFYSANETGDSSTFPCKEGLSSVVRQATTLDEIVLDDSFFKEKKEIALLKLEAEGAEPEILEGAKKILPHVRYVTADCGAERGVKQENTLVPVMQILQQHGFEPVSFGLPRAVMLFKNSNFHASNQ
jgi:FkbM family methyltransferase